MCVCSVWDVLCNSKYAWTSWNLNTTKTCRLHELTKLVLNLIDDFRIQLDADSFAFIWPGFERSVAISFPETTGLMQQPLCCTNLFLSGKYEWFESFYDITSFLILFSLRYGRVFLTSWVMTVWFTAFLYDTEIN